MSYSQKSDLRLQPNWIKHDNQVLRFYCEVDMKTQQEPQFRDCVLLYYLENDTIQVNLSRTSESDIPGGTLFKRAKIPLKAIQCDNKDLMISNSESYVQKKEKSSSVPITEYKGSKCALTNSDTNDWRKQKWSENQLHISPECDIFRYDHFDIGMRLMIHERSFLILGVDDSTRRFYESQGITIVNNIKDFVHSPKESKSAFKNSSPSPISSREASKYTEIMLGGGRNNPGLAQFIQGDGKVLRFYVLWDDKSYGGVRRYFVLHFFLVDDTIEIVESSTSAPDSASTSYRDQEEELQCHGTNEISREAVHTLFLKRQALTKDLSQTGCRDVSSNRRYLPEDLVCGSFVRFHGREFLLYDCDSFTKDFFIQFNGQIQNRVDISPEQVKVPKALIPPHIGIGKPEDSILSCYSLSPKPVKVDMKMYLDQGDNALRFNAVIDTSDNLEHAVAKNIPGTRKTKMDQFSKANELDRQMTEELLTSEKQETEIHNSTRKFVVTFYLADSHVAVWEIPVKNSGQTAGKFSEKGKKINPLTELYFCRENFFIGAHISISGVTFRLTESDKFTSDYLAGATHST